MKVRAAYFGVFTALALIFSYVESLIPFHIGIPGVKLGLANLIIVIALYKMNVKSAYLLSVTRVVLSGFMFGSLFGILYGGRAAEFDSDDNFEEKRRFQHNGYQHCRRRKP